MLSGILSYFHDHTNIRKSLFFWNFCPSHFVSWVSDVLPKMTVNFRSRWIKSGINWSDIFETRTLVMLEQDLKEQGIWKNSVEVKLVIRSLRGLPCHGSSGVHGVRTSGERSLIRIFFIICPTLVWFRIRAEYVITWHQKWSKDKNDGEEKGRQPILKWFREPIETSPNNSPVLETEQLSIYCWVWSTHFMEENMYSREGKAKSKWRGRGEDIMGAGGLSSRGLICLEVSPCHVVRLVDET